MSAGQSVSHSVSQLDVWDVCTPFMLRCTVQLMALAGFDPRYISRFGRPSGKRRNVFPLILGGKVALNRLRPLPQFNATFPPDIKEKTLWSFWIYGQF